MRSGEASHPGHRSVVIRFDGSCPGNPGPEAGAGAVAFVCGDDGGEAPLVTARVPLRAAGAGSAGGGLSVLTNNIAEYMGLLLALLIALDLRERAGVDVVRIEGDSELVVTQLCGEAVCGSRVLQRFLDVARALLALLRDRADVRVVHIPRKGNADADAEARLAVGAFRSLASAAAGAPDWLPSLLGARDAPFAVAGKCARAGTRLSSRHTGRASATCARPRRRGGRRSPKREGRSREGPREGLGEAEIRLLRA